MKSFLNIVFAALVEIMVLSCSTRSVADKNRLMAEGYAADLTEQADVPTYLRFFIDRDLFQSKDEVLEGDTCYGYMKVVKRPKSGLPKTSDRSFYFTNLRETGEYGVATFSVVYDSGRKKVKRSVIENCRMELVSDTEIRLLFDEDSPFSQSYDCAIEFNDFFVNKPLDNSSFAAKMSSVLGLSLSYNYGDRYFYNLLSPMLLLFFICAIVTLWHLIINRAWSLVLGYLFVAALMVFSMYHKWTISVALVIPFFISPTLYVIPIVRKFALALTIILTIAAVGVFVYNAFSIHGFWIGLWKTIYIGACSFMPYYFFMLCYSDRHCSHCGRFTCLERPSHSYEDAYQYLSAPLNMEGNSVFNKNSINPSTGSGDEAICYWCENRFQRV